jgi:1-acyl-sn-glycerol-3-phosphate acyltransferase
MAAEGKQMVFGEDGSLDAHGNPLPVLSKSASKMKIDRLMNTPLPTFHGSTPGSRFWTWIATNMLRSTLFFQFRSYQVSGRENIPQEGGTLCCGWHTNGLIDPAAIMTSHPKNFVIGGRHDLVTRPIIGFWARKMAVQPVVRQAELIRGGCSEEVAATLNGRSLLNLSTGISHGFGCFLFPEGTSHDESHILRFKTGPMRTALSAAALAKGNGKPAPTIIPIGLHWRVRHHWRTDAWIEYGEPIKVEAESLGPEVAEKLARGEWNEPPADIVNSLREELRQRLQPMTPDAPDWPTHRAWHLLGHLEGAAMGRRPKTWRGEVLVARQVRDRMATTPDEERLAKARDVAEILEEKRLDARALTNTGEVRKASILAAPKNALKLLIGLLMLPFFIPSSGILAISGKYLGDKNIENEGLDARTSYQLLISMFGSFFLWPPIALIIALVSVFIVGDSTWMGIAVGVVGNEWMTVLIMTPTLVILFLLSALTTVNAWDSVEDIRRAMRRSSLRRSPDGAKVQKLCQELLSSPRKQ